MNILFYSTSSNYYEAQNAVTHEFPSCASGFELLAEKYPEHSFILATQFPGMFLVDLNEDKISPRAENVRYEIINYDDEKQIADFLTSLKPDLAVASTFYLTPFDWLTAKDAIVAKFLRQNGIKTLCHSVNTALTCFDKWHTHQALKELKINVPEAVYINHALFINAGNRKTIKSNVYRTALLEQIKELNFPVIIKDTTGLSSYGMDVLENFSKVHDWLNSKKFTSDRIIEEFIQGTQFGVEIESSFDEKSSSARHKILPPVIFSVNKYGITSPKQSVKAGPVILEEYKLEELNSMLQKIAQSFNLEGITQLDLVFDGKKWFVIEINPRLSGMTNTYSAMQGTTTAQRLFNLTGLDSENKGHIEKNDFVLNIKTELLTQKEFQKLASMDFVKHVYQIENKNARQLRERGYCEVIFTAETKEKLGENLNALYREFPQKTEEAFYKTAVELIKKL